MLSRRQLIFGKSGANFALNPGASHHESALRPAFGESCLPARGVVCRSCGEACAAAAIAFRPAARGVSLPTLNSERCTGCGDCVAICPVGAVALRAIEFPEELPA